MLKAFFKKYTFHFKQPGGTSRGVLVSKNSWFIVIYDSDYPNLIGVGECSILSGLSIDDRPDFETQLHNVCDKIEDWQYWLEEGLFDFPSIRFGLEMAIKDIAEEGDRILFTSEFTNGNAQIPINGLVWMGDYKIMYDRLVEKIELGFSCVKLKIGAINFEEELSLMLSIRKDFQDTDIEIRLDANGAFSSNEVIEKLKRLSEFNIHSIEQPIKQNQWEEMAEVCLKSPIPIALDEELIGIKDRDKIKEMLSIIQPQYIILKPSLLGGFSQSSVFIQEAENQNIGWWVTSALEANIGLNAIAQWTYTLGSNMPQGLGTGEVFTNNIISPLAIKDGSLLYNPSKSWDLKNIINE